MLDLSCQVSRMMLLAGTGGHEALISAAPESIQRLSLSSVEEQSQAVADVLAKMTSKTVQQLVMMKTSKQYLQRLVRALEQKSGQHDKFLWYSRRLTGGSALTFHECLCQWCCATLGTGLLCRQRYGLPVACIILSL